MSDRTHKNDDRNEDIGKHLKSVKKVLISATKILVNMLIKMCQFNTNN